MVVAFPVSGSNQRLRIFQITIPAYWSNGSNKYIDYQVPIFIKFVGSNDITHLYQYTLNTQPWINLYVYDGDGNLIDTLSSTATNGNIFTIDGGNTSRAIEVQSAYYNYSALLFCNNYKFRYYPRAYTTEKTLIFNAIFSWQINANTSGASPATTYGYILNNNNNITNKSIFSTGTAYKTGSTDVSFNILNTSYSITEIQSNSNTYGELNCLNVRSSGLASLNDVNITGDIEFNGKTLTNMLINPSYYLPSWDSGWFQVTTNQIYNFNTYTTGGYEINMLYPPILQVLFGFSSNPNLGVTDKIFDITGQGMNSNFSQSYIFRYYSTKQVSIKTGVSNVALTIENSNNSNLSYTTGYYRIILR